MFFHRRTTPGLAILSYMVGDDQSKRCAVIDPVRDVEEYLQLAREKGMEITDILETHVHADFVSGSRELKARLDGRPQIHCSAMGGDEWTPTYADHAVKNGESVQLGTIRLQGIHTPGHTSEHMIWALYDETRSPDTPWLYFTGDFLFVGSIGRPDLLGKEAQKTLAHQLYQSVFQTFPNLPDFAEAFPAHGAGSLCGKAIGSRPSTTIGFERRFNASFEEAPEQSWVKDLMQDMPPAPPYFARMKKINVEGPPILGPEYPGRTPISADQVKNCVILDVRKPEAFAKGHIPGSINIPYSPSLATWAGWLIPYDQPIALVLDTPKQASEVTLQLIRIGIDNLVGYLEGGVSSWNGDLESINPITVEDLATMKDKVYLIDVRTETEWKAGHIPGSHNIHAGLLPSQAKTIPKEKPIAVICEGGYRSAVASSILKKEGISEILNIQGGMKAWKDARKQTVVETA